MLLSDELIIHNKKIVGHLAMVKNKNDTKTPDLFEEAQGYQSEDPSSTAKKSKNIHNTLPLIHLRAGPLNLNTQSRKYTYAPANDNHINYGIYVKRGKLTEPQCLTLSFIAQSNLENKKPTYQEIATAIYKNPVRPKIGKIILNLNSLFRAEARGTKDGLAVSKKINMINVDKNGECSFSDAFPLANVRFISPP